MPTETFFRLPREKREKIHQAIHNEFSRVPYEDVSINRIIHEAQIPRGSFYQYFEGKEDLFQYLLQEYHDRFLAYAREDIVSSSGDPFAFSLLIYDRIVDFMEASPEDMSFLKHILGNLRFQDQQFFSRILEAAKWEYREMLEKIDTEAFRDPSEEGVALSVEILVSAMQASLCRLLRPNADSRTERERLMKKHDLIRYGLMVRKESAC